MLEPSTFRRISPRRQSAAHVAITLLAVLIAPRASLADESIDTDDLFPTNIGDKWGFADGQDHFAIPLQYEDAQLFSEGLAAVKRDGKWGYIDAHGKTKVPFFYDYGQPFCEGLAPVGTGEKWGFVNRSGKLVIPTTFDWVQGFSEGLSAVTENGRLKYIDRQGVVRIDNGDSDGTRLQGRPRRR
jgi:hypothetical protein